MTSSEINKQRCTRILAEYAKKTKSSVRINPTPDDLRIASRSSSLFFLWPKLCVFSHAKWKTGAQIQASSHNTATTTTTSSRGVFHPQCVLQIHTKYKCIWNKQIRVVAYSKFAISKTELLYRKQPPSDDL